ncbi:hypothetical protein SAMN04488003_1232 [Loktanella fryxellensis]|uniref:Uncharacterized protein n=1 Tax=Loktanella fryxellensis TaxID=245187 RepID=A0A1H8HY63_9RHOB|nr:hypothetical protein [Loktanella fryxellensis]SEN61350.1 hypothetical protein SAMN04488003_1232 [Loktanella fryxellensis]
MVRAPTKTCPNLYRIIEDAELHLLAAFLKAKAFERLEWLKQYHIDLTDPDTRDAARIMFSAENKDRLKPLETEAARIIKISGKNGQFALEGLARTKLDSECTTNLLGQRDDLGRSLAAYIQQHMLFEAAGSVAQIREGFML